MLKNNYVYYIADFPQRTKLANEIVAKNEALAERLNKKGIFPALVIVDKNMKIKKVLGGSASYSETLSVLKYNK